MPNIFDKQSDILKKKKTSGVRPYNFHQKIDEHLQQSNNNSKIDGDEAKKTGTNKSKVLKCDDKENPLTSPLLLSSEKPSALPTTHHHPLPVTEYVPNRQKSDRNQVEIRTIADTNQTDTGQIIDRYQAEPSESKLNETLAALEEKGDESVRNQADYRQKSDRNQVDYGKIQAEPIGRNQTEHQIDEQIENQKKSGRIIIEPKLSAFVGLQRQTLLFLFKETQFSREPRITDELNIAQIAFAIQKSRNNAKNVILEIVKKGAVYRHESKDGPGGWTRFRFHDPLYNDLVLFESKGKQAEIRQKSDRNQIDSSSSSGDLHMNQTTTAYQPKAHEKELPLNWREIDYSCLGTIGFRECHIKQIFESGKVTPEMVQESIYELDHDLKSESHGMKSPLLVILKLLRSKGESYTAITPGYVSEELRYERKRLEELKRRNEELAQLKSDQERLNTLPAELEKVGRFQTWHKGS